jgi:hypothetical protein
MWGVGGFACKAIAFIVKTIMSCYDYPIDVINSWKWVYVIVLDGYKKWLQTHFDYQPASTPGIKFFWYVLDPIFTKLGQDVGE